MKKDWLQKELEKYSKLAGYKKPDKFPKVIKLDSNENYAIAQDFIQKMINEVKEDLDVREYPLGGIERLVQAISKYLGMPKEMIGVGNGSDQIIDLIFE